MALHTVSPPAAPPLSPTAASPRGVGRWITYQRERFPVLGHGALIAAFSGGAVCYSAQLRLGAGHGPSLASVLVAFASCLLFFFQLRVADEFKDFEEDARHRPYRPVPRGLVTLRELGTLGAVGVAVQVALALWLAPALLLPLLAVLAYMALMTAEFGVRDWLRARPVTVLWTHMLIMPLIDLYATATDWLAAGGAHAARGASGSVVGAGIAWFLLTSFCNGIVVEVGRKIRAPEDEEPGVETYSALWGRGRAVRVWILAMVATAAAAAFAARAIGGATAVLLLLGTLLVAGSWLGARLVRAPRAGMGRRLELVSGLWTLAVYLGVGVLPLLLHGGRS